MNVVKSNIDVLVKEGLGPRADTDFLLARDTCLALLKLGVAKTVSSHIVMITCLYHVSRVMRKPDFCLCENKDADQLRSNCDQRLCFRYLDSTIPFLQNFKLLAVS